MDEMSKRYFVYICQILQSRSKNYIPNETPIKKSSPKPGCGNFNFTKLGKTLIYWFVILSTLNKPGLVSMYTAKPIGPIFALDLMIDPRNV